MRKSMTRALCMVCVLSSGIYIGCKGSDPVAPTVPPEVVTSKYFISAVGGDVEAKDYLLSVDALSSGSVSIKGNGLELPRSGYSWIFPTASNALGFIYQKGDPGVGLGITVNSKGEIVMSGSEFLIESRFTTYGVCNGVAITAVSGQAVPGKEEVKQSIFNVIDPNKGNAKVTKNFVTTNMTGNGEFFTLSGIVDAGNGEFITSLVPSKSLPSSSTGGGSTGESDYPDSVWVAKFDTDFKLKKIYGDDRLSYSSGRMRSQYYSQIGSDDQGNTYVFSSAYNPKTTKKAGVIRISKGSDVFDSNYYWDIASAAGGFNFMKVWHIDKNYFLLNFYNKVGSTNFNDGVTKYAVVDVVLKTLRWVDKGLPAPTEITAVSDAYCFDGHAYLPVTAEHQKPAVYEIDPVTATAKRGLEVDANSIRGIGKLSVKP